MRFTANSHCVHIKKGRFFRSKADSTVTRVECERSVQGISLNWRYLEIWKILAHNLQFFGLFESGVALVGPGSDGEGGLSILRRRPSALRNAFNSQRLAVDSAQTEGWHEKKLSFSRSGFAQ
jgi:hypothetical protein